MIFSMILALSMSGQVGTSDTIVLDPYGRIRHYTANDLTVDKTWRNAMILKSMRKEHNDAFFRGRSPQISTHKGRGYMYNVNPYDPMYHRYMIHDRQQFDKYLRSE